MEVKPLTVSKDKNDAKRKSMEFAEFKPISTPNVSKKIVPPSRIDSVSQNPVVQLINALGGLHSIGFEKMLPLQIPIQDIHDHLPLEEQKEGPETKEELNIKTPFLWLRKFMAKDKKDLNKKSEVKRFNLEKNVYEMAHQKLSDPYRPFHQRVLITNVMLYIMASQTGMNIRDVGPYPKRKGSLTLDKGRVYPSRHSSRILLEGHKKLEDKSRMER